MSVRKKNQTFFFFHEWWKSNPMSMSTKLELEVTVLLHFVRVIFPPLFDQDTYQKKKFPNPGTRINFEYCTGGFDRKFLFF